MIVGQYVALVALEEEAKNIVERPWSSNHDGGGWIDESQDYWNLSGEPWCGMAKDKIFRIAGIDDHGLCHPATWVTCQRADAMGGLRPKGAPCPGSIVINCGKHIEVLIRTRSSGLLECIGGNVNQGLRETVRDPHEWRIIEVPGLRERYDDGPDLVKVYWFEDPRVDPERYGGWRTRQMRLDWINKHIPKNQRHLVRLIKTNSKRAPYALDLYSGEQYKWGPWRNLETRNRIQFVVEREKGYALRARSKDIPIEEAGSEDLRRPRRIAVTRGDTVT